MQRLLLVLILLLLPSLSKADSINVPDLFSKLPSLKQGFAYDIQGKYFEYFTSVEVANYKGFSFSGGYTTSNKIITAIDYDLGGLNQLGINTPITNLIDLRVGFMVGMGNISTSNGEDRNKVAYGPECTIVSLKF